MKKSNQHYVGDGLYASYDGFALWLTAPREHGDHEVALEPHVLLEFLRWAAEIPRYNRLLLEFVRKDLTPTLPE